MIQKIHASLLLMAVLWLSACVHHTANQMPCLMMVDNQTDTRLNFLINHDDLGQFANADLDKQIHQAVKICNVNQISPQSQFRPIELATLYGYPHLVALLLANGANPNLTVSHPRDGIHGKNLFEFAHFLQSRPNQPIKQQKFRQIVELLDDYQKENHEFAKQ